MLGIVPLRRQPAAATAWLLTLFLSVLGYELLRFVVVRRIKSRLHEGAVRFVRRHRVHHAAALRVAALVEILGRPQAQLQLEFIDALETVVADHHLALGVALRAAHHEAHLDAGRQRLDGADEVASVKKRLAFDRADDVADLQHALRGHSRNESSHAHAGRAHDRPFHADPERAARRKHDALLEHGELADVYGVGLDAFLERFLRNNVRLGESLQAAYMEIK
jgi:hypothetical protein